MEFNTRKKILVTHALYGGGPVTSELTELGYQVTGQDRLNVSAYGTLKDAIRLNVLLRTAHRILFHLFEFKANDLKDLYNGFRRFNWMEVIPEDGYFSINSYCNQPGIRDTRIVNLKGKDAIADLFVSRTGRRPDSGNENNRLVLFIYWIKNDCTVYIDTSGESIAKHGYRKQGWKAPLSEALAASIIQSTVWDQKSPFINPMCGSGTLAIEAALIASRRFPGLHRKNYSFMHVKGFREEYLNEIKKAHDVPIGDQNVPLIIATDVHGSALRATRMNAEKAGVENMIRFAQCGFEDTQFDPGKGIVIMNPEYGERMGKTDLLKTTYQDIGNFFKKRCEGMTGYVFTGNPDLAKSIGLRTRKKIPFMNGDIECRLLEYELYSGSHKNKSKDTRDATTG